MKKLLTACAMALVLSGCAVTASDEVVSAKKETGAFGTTKSDLDVTSAKTFNGVEEVIIGGFVIGYDIESSAASHSGGGLMGRSNSASAKVTLEGVDNATLQKITDQVYADFVADLKAKGYKVADRSALLSHPDFSKASAQENPYIDKSGGMLTAASETRYFAPSGFGKIYNFSGTGKGVGFGDSNPAIGAAKFAEDKSSPRVLHVHYAVDFAHASGRGGMFNRNSTLQVGQGLSVAAGSSLNIITGYRGSMLSNNGSIRLGQPVEAGKAFATIEDTTSDAYKATEVALNLVGAIAGGSGKQSRSFVVKADPAKFQSAALEALKKTNGTLIGKMHSLK